MCFPQPSDNRFAQNGFALSERIQLVEDIWDSIAADAESIELTELEKRILDERLEAYHLNLDLGSPWADVYKKMMKNYRQ